VEGERLIRRGSRYTHHVHAAVAHRLEQRAQLRPGWRRPARLKRRPHRAACEHGDAVDRQRKPVRFEPLAAAKLAKAGVPTVDPQRLAANRHQEREPVKAGLAMGVRPPARDRRNSELAADGQLACVHRQLEFRAMAPTRPLEFGDDALRRGLAERAKADREAEHAVAAVDARPQRKRRELEPAAALERNRTPRTDNSRAGGKPRRASEQHCAEEPQPAFADEPRAPARPRSATDREQRTERAAADRQIVARRERRRHIHRRAREHRVATKHQGAVQIDLGDGREPFDHEHEPLARCRRRHGKVAAKPPVAPVERRSCDLRRRHAGGREDIGGATGNESRAPVEPIKILRGGVRTSPWLGVRRHPAVAQLLEHMPL